ncbi:hypothetical protein AB1Y20_010634 [Prymnesium parvum]|uniref:Uncharacterized protein n=1 Tax=Prymnesium parvum TaxID=97485 RepID=A0AB34IQ97_PRYPA
MADSVQNVEVDDKKTGDKKADETKSDEELRQELAAKQAELNTVKEKARPNYPRWPKQRPSWRILIGPIIFYYGIRKTEEPTSLATMIFPIFCFTLALFVGQSIVEWIDRMEWRVKLREEAEKKYKEKAGEDQQKEKNDQKPKLRPSTSSVGSAKKRS